MIKKIIHNLLALFTGEMIARICHFISVIYIARLFGAAGFGAINFSIAIVAYLFIVANLGLCELGVREVSRKADLKEVAQTILSVRFCISAVLFVLLLIAVFFVKKTNINTALIIAYSVTLFPYALSLEWIFRGIERMKYNGVGRIINATLYLALILLFVRSPEDLLKVALITITADSVTSFFYYLNFKKMFGPIKLHIDIKKWFSLVSISTQLFVSSAMIIVYINFGIIGLGIIKDERLVGIYGAAAKLIFFVYAISDLFVAAMFPVMSRLYHESVQKFEEFMGRCMKFTLAMALPVGVGGAILGPKIIQFVYGASYKESGPLFQILSWYAAINLVSFVLSYSLVACGRQNTYLKILVSAALVNIVFNLAAIPFIGYFAPSIGLVLTEVVIFTSSFFVVKRIVKLPILKLYAKPLIASLAMGAILFLLFKLNVLILMGVAVVSYSAILFAFGGITKNEIMKIREAFV